MRERGRVGNLWDAIAKTLATDSLSGVRQYCLRVFRIRQRNGGRIVCALVAMGTTSASDPAARVQNLVELAQGQRLGEWESEDGLVAAMVFEMNSVPTEFWHECIRTPGPNDRLHAHS